MPHITFTTSFSSTLAGLVALAVADVGGKTERHCPVVLPGIAAKATRSFRPG